MSGSPANIAPRPLRPPRAGAALSAVSRWWQDRRRPAPAPVVGLVISGGGATASFHLGALRYLYDVVGITPTVITGTSAGSLLAALLAQADDQAGQRQVLSQIEQQYTHFRQPSDMMIERDWFTELLKLVPALQWAGHARAPHLEPQTIALPALSLSRPRRRGEEWMVAPGTGPVIRLPRWDPTPVRETLSVVWSVGRSRPDFEALLRGGRHEQSLFQHGPIFDDLLGPQMFDADRLARSATELRVAVVALESGELRYVTGRGVLVDRADQPVPGEEAVSLVDAVHASCAIPAVFPPVRLGDEHYVDGGTRENLPVEVAMRHLGVTRCYAISSLPSGVPEDTSYADKDMLAIVLRATAGIMADEVKLHEIARAEAAGAVLIAPEVDVLGILEVDPGLLAIAKDYGYLRAAEACEGAGPGETQVTTEVVQLRRRIWKQEREWAMARAADPAGAVISDIGRLKVELRDLVARVPSSRLPPGAASWWQTWEQHPVAIEQPVDWVAGASLPGSPGG